MKSNNFLLTINLIFYLTLTLFLNDNNDDYNSYVMIMFIHLLTFEFKELYLLKLFISFQIIFFRQSLLSIGDKSVPNLKDHFKVSNYYKFNRIRTVRSFKLLDWWEYLLNVSHSKAVIFHINSCCHMVTVQIICKWLNLNPFFISCAFKPEEIEYIIIVISLNHLLSTNDYNSII